MDWRRLLVATLVIGTGEARGGDTVAEARTLAEAITSGRTCSTTRDATSSGQVRELTTCTYKYKGLKFSLSLKTATTSAEFRVEAVPASKLSLHFIVGEPAMACMAEVNEWQRPGGTGPVVVRTAYVDSRTGNVFALGDQPSCLKE